MQPDWNYVKQTTLWQYEELIKKLLVVTRYPLIWQVYNHTMPQAVAFARDLFANRDLQAGEYPAAVITTMEHLHHSGVRSWQSLLDQVVTRDDCNRFMSEHHLEFRELINLLNYLLRFGFPFQTATRELLAHDNPDEMAGYDLLKQHKLLNSFDLLEQGHMQLGRRQLAEVTGLPLDFVTALVHRADIARLPYVRRKTILAVCGAGYDTLARISNADRAQMETDLDAYFRRTQGKPWENFKAVIVLKELITGAQALPVIVEE